MKQEQLAVQPMVLAVVGDTYYSDYKTFSKIVSDELERYPAAKIITGDSSGADTMAYDYALEHYMPLKVYCASRSTYQRLRKEGTVAELSSDIVADGKAASPMRNFRMLRAAGKVLLFNGGGAESLSVKRIARKLRIEVEEWLC